MIVTFDKMLFGYPVLCEYLIQFGINCILLVYNLFKFTI